MTALTPYSSQIPVFFESQSWNREAWGHFFEEMPTQYDPQKWGEFHDEQDGLERRIQAVNDEMEIIAAAFRKTHESSASAIQAPTQELKEPPRYFCHVQGCEKSFTRIFGLRKHVINFHGPEHLEGLKLPSQVKNRKLSKEPIEPQIFLCHVQDCEKSYTRKYELAKHVIKIHGHEHLEDLKAPSKEEKRYPCPHLECTSGFERERDLKVHRIDQHGEVLKGRKRTIIPDSQKKFVCPTCQHRVGSENGLEKHIKIKHR